METEKAIVHVVHFTSQTGGIEVLIPGIINEMTSGAFRLFVIRPPILDKINVYDGIDTPITYGDNSNWKALIKFWKYAREHRNDIFHLYNAGPFYTLLLKEACVKKIIYSIHGTIYWKKPTQKVIRKAIWYLALHNRITIISNSIYSKACFLKATGYKKSIVNIYNPIASARYTPDGRKSKDSKKTIIYTGRLTPGKNLFKWLDIASLIHKRFPDYCFEIYGQGLLRESLEEYTEKKGLTNKVLFKGFVKDIENVYRNADLMIFLSEYESFGNVVVESILCGTPVIVSNIPSMKEIFENFPEFMVDLDDQLEQNILQKVEQLEQINSLVPKAMSEFRQRFSVEQHIQKLENIYKSFCA